MSLLVLPGGGLRGQDQASSSQQVIMGRLPCASPTDPRAHGVRQLVWELMKRTSIEGQMEPRQADPANPDLFNTPFLLWSCDGEVASLSDTQQKNLRRFLSLGGFLVEHLGLIAKGTADMPLESTFSNGPPQPIPLHGDHVDTPFPGNSDLMHHLYRIRLEQLIPIRGTSLIHMCQHKLG